MATILSTDNRLPSTVQKWALFDLDWTLIRPTTTERRPTLAGGPLCIWEDDWKIIPGRTDRLKDFVRENYTIGVVTNQKYTGQKLHRAFERIRRVRIHLMDELQVEIYTMISTDDRTMAKPDDPTTKYRKPGTGWSFHLGFLPGSLYVGDAIQDPDRPDRGSGFSDSDRQFALNIGLPFYTPDEVFPQFSLPLDPDRLVLILVGVQGSGKSTFAKSLDGIHIENDQFKSNRTKIDRSLKEAIPNSSLIIMDGTHPSRERRLELIQIAREQGAEVAIVLFLNSGKWIRAAGRRPIPKIAIYRYWADFEEPDEGVPVYYQF